MFKRSFILLFLIFFLLIFSASIIKNKSRNLEKEIYKLKKDISFLQKEVSDAEIDYIYLSSPEILSANLNKLKKNEYYPFEYSRIFKSLNQYLNDFSKNITKIAKKGEK